MRRDDVFLAEISSKWRQRNLREREETLARKRLARVEAHRLARRFAEEGCGPRRVCLFGSCLRIAKFFENSLDPSTWHRDLVGRMTLDIRGVRPALFAREATGPIEELRAFRRVFRNLCARRLDPAKVAAVQRHVPVALAAVRGAYPPFCEVLRRIAADV